jgi:hypothetical protein
MDVAQRMALMPHDPSGIVLELLHAPARYTDRQIDQAFRVAGQLKTRGRFVLLEPPRNET